MFNGKVVYFHPMKGEDRSIASLTLYHNRFTWAEGTPASFQ